MDRITPEQRSRIMSEVRATHSRPEVLMRSMLHRMGFRFRINSRHLPGSPDITLKKYSAAIFIHGCFWHMHENCKNASLPSSNASHWKKKLLRNRERDRQNIEDIKKMGWRPYVVWECELMNDPHKVADKISCFLLGKKLDYALPEKRQMLKIAEKRRKYLREL